MLCVHNCKCGSFSSSWKKWNTGNRKTHIFIRGEVAGSKERVKPCETEHGPHREERYHGNQQSKQRSRKMHPLLFIHMVAQKHETSDISSKLWQVLTDFRKSFSWMFQRKHPTVSLYSARAVTFVALDTIIMYYLLTLLSVKVVTMHKVFCSFSDTVGSIHYILGTLCGFCVCFLLYTSNELQQNYSTWYSTDTLHTSTVNWLKGYLVGESFNAVTKSASREPA